MCLEHLRNRKLEIEFSYIGASYTLLGHIGIFLVALLA